MKSGALSLVHPYADSFISKSNKIKTVTDLFDEKYLNYDYQNEISLSISDAEAKQIE